MGAGGSKDELQARLDEQRQQEKARYESQMAIIGQFDQRTKVPHLLIELRNVGFVEICGKDLGGIYQKLDTFFRTQWKATEATHSMQSIAGEDDCGCAAQVRFGMGPKETFDEVCDQRYVCGNQQMDGRVQANGVYQYRGSEGENNMGKLTMSVVNFMTNECGWGLQLCDGGNLGRVGQFREQQIKFKAPHPLNLMAPHIMIEIRQVGYIEVNGPNTGGIYQRLADWFQQKWGCRQVQADPAYCDQKFSTNAFKSRGSQGENNMGLRTMEIADFMTKEMTWTLLTCTGGNYGRKGDKREQQLVFRNDEFVQHGEAHLMVEFRDQGFIELNGTHDAPEAFQQLDQFYRQKGCSEYKAWFFESSEKFCDMKYETPAGFYYRQGTTNNLGKLTIELATFLGQRGWMLLLCNGGNVSDYTGYNIKREQQVKFTRGRKGEKTDAPLLMIELRTIPTSSEGYFNGYIEINGPNTNGIYERLQGYMQQTMLCQPAGRMPYCDLLMNCGCFRLREMTNSWQDWRWDGRLQGESNFGRYTMRLCDFMVDQLGEWDLVVCSGNSIDSVFRVNKDTTISVTGREQQLIFRHRPGGRNVFMAANTEVSAFGRAPMQAPPYWKDSTKSGTKGQEIVPATAEEKAWIQQILDGTYKNKTTRDGKGRALAKRFVCVSALRSEHPQLWDKFAHRRADVHKKIKDRGDSTFVTAKTMDACSSLAQRVRHPKVGNPTNEVYLLHGSNPTSAISILGTSFKVDLAGASVGTMFGPGIYMAESSTKSDEYARDESTGSAYDGLYAVLLCRVVMGSSYVVEKPGDYKDKCISGDFDSVVGDREKAVGTFREIIIFDEGSIYPEYVAFYRREYEEGEEPAPAAAPVASGSSMPGPAVYGAATPDQQSMAGPRTCQVAVPPGAEAGQTIQAQTPWGATIQLTLPEGCVAGQVLTVQA